MTAARYQGRNKSISSLTLSFSNTLPHCQGWHCARFGRGS